MELDLSVIYFLDSTILKLAPGNMIRSQPEIMCTFARAIRSWSISPAGKYDGKTLSPNSSFERVRASFFVLFPFVSFAFALRLNLPCHSENYNVFCLKHSLGPVVQS